MSFTKNQRKFSKKSYRELKNYLRRAYDYFTESALYVSQVYGEKEKKVLSITSLIKGRY
jgi:hypothetical protein